MPLFNQTVPKKSNGLTIQWGIVTCSNGSAPVSGLMFTSGNTYKIVTIGYYNNSPEKVGINSKTATSCTLGSDFSGSFSLEWLAIGY